MMLGDLESFGRGTHGHRLLLLEAQEHQEAKGEIAAAAEMHPANLSHFIFGNKYFVCLI